MIEYIFINIYIGNNIYEFKCLSNRINLKEIKIYIENINNELLNNNYDIYYLDEEEDLIHLKDEEDLKNAIKTIENLELKLIVNQIKNKESTNLNNFLKDINNKEIEEFYNNFEINEEIENKFNDGKIVCGNCFGKDQMIFDCDLCKKEGYIDMNYRELYLTKYLNNLLFKTENDIKKLIENNIVNENKIKEKVETQKELNDNFFSSGDLDLKETVKNKSKIFNYICEECGSNPIKTDVYQCKVCDDFQICQICKDEIDHNPDHKFEIIKNDFLLKTNSHNKKVFQKKFSLINNNSFNYLLENLDFKIDFFSYDIQKKTDGIDYLNIKYKIINEGNQDFPNTFEIEYNKKIININKVKPKNHMILNFEVNFKKTNLSKDLILKFSINNRILKYNYKLKIKVNGDFSGEYKYDFQLIQQLSKEKTKNIFG